MYNQFVFFVILLSVLVIASCSSTVKTKLSKTYQPLDYKDKVIVIALEEKQPLEAEVLGTIKIGDSGFSIKCNYETALNKAKLEARKAGGNAIKITEHKTPNFMSTCHRISANILKLQTPQTSRNENSLLYNLDAYFSFLSTRSSRYYSYY